MSVFCRFVRCVVFVRWCSYQGTLLDLILIGLYQDVGIDVINDDDETVIYCQFVDNFQQLCTFV